MQEAKLPDESLEAREKSVARALIANRPENINEWWGWPQTEHPLTKKGANKFLLACALDYRQNKDHDTWAAVEAYVEGTLGDPEDLWEVLRERSDREFVSLLKEMQEHGLHYMLQGLTRIPKIATNLCRRFDGDARNIWSGDPEPAVVTGLLEDRVEIGPAIARMATGTSIDCGLLHGRGDIKPDTHTRRVLARVLNGNDDSLHAIDAVRAARRLHPENPWLIDRSLYTLGTGVCRAAAPRCEGCCMNSCCAWAALHSRRLDSQKGSELKQD